LQCDCKFVLIKHKVMVIRDIESSFFRLLSKFPAVNVTGPRQSGKTTLVKSLLKEYKYYSFENPDTRILATEDPRAFLREAGDRFILDEAQRVPHIFSYLQQVLDESPHNGKVVLLGSQSFLMNEQITQSLAGRMANLKLLPLSLRELSSANLCCDNLNKILFEGFYPRLFNEKIQPTDFYPNYIETYLQRDVRSLKNIGDLQTFTKFIKLCAGRVGNVLNLSSLANDADMSVNTAKSWLSVLEASYIAFLLHPFSNNSNKRWIKMPKLYFYDTGLACSLLNLNDEKQIETFYMKGNLFENMVVAEMYKEQYNRALTANFYFLRDSKGNEIDCVIERAEKPLFVEIKMSETFSPQQIKNLKLMRNNQLNPNENFVIYSGKDEMTFQEVKYLNFLHIGENFFQ